MFTFTLRLQVRPREAASCTCCQRMQSKFILLLPTKYLPKMNILRSFLHPPPRFWKSYNCTLMPFLIYPVSKIRACEKSQSHVNAFSSIAPQYLTPMCQHAHYVFSIQRYLGRPFQKVCQSNLNPLPTQDLKKGDLLGKGADAVVSIFLLPGNHKVIFFIRIT